MTLQQQQQQKQQQQQQQLDLVRAVGKQRHIVPSARVCFVYPPGPTAGPGSPRNGSVSDKCRLHSKAAPETSSKARPWTLLVIGRGAGRIGKSRVDGRDRAPLGFRGFAVAILGFPAGFPIWASFRVCVSVAVLLSVARIEKPRVGAVARWRFDRGKAP